MKRFILLFLAAAALAACDRPSRGNEGIASVQVLPDDRTLAVGETLKLSVVVRDKSGDEPDEKRLDKVEYSSDNNAVATVSPDGTVTGVAPGTATIRAELDDESGSVVVRVAAAPLACAQGGAVRSLGVGEAVVLGGVSASVVCLDGGATGKEYVAVPFHSGEPGDDAFGVTFDTEATLPLAAPSVSPSVALANGLVPDEDFHSRLRERSERTLARHHAAALSVSPRRAPAGGDMAPSLVLNLRSPAVGDQVTVNTSLEPCKDPKNVNARVVAISERSIVLADEGNPANGLTSAEYQAFARGFDTLVHPVITSAFGAAEDLDRNGKSVILYTKAVNELTPPGSTSYVGGYFHPRDLFPTRDRDGLAACATTNYAEIFYMLVPDPNGQVNGNAFSRDLVLQTSLGTLAHEYQHLINASRRLYVVETSSWNEDTWLNEALSHVAEEVLFYHSAQLGPRRNLGPVELGTPRAQAAFRSYMDQNLRRYQRYLQEVETQSPYDADEGDADDLATRGAGWAFLRYAADRRGGDDTALWKDLVDASVTGLPNLQQALGRDPREWIRDWATSVYTDDLVATEARFQQPSWRFRGFFNTYPLAVRSLADGTGVQIKSGTAAYLRFRVPPAVVGTVRALSGAGPLPSKVYLTVVRTR